MKTLSLIPLVLAGFVVACDGQGNGKEGDACNTNADCADGLECHEHDGEKECEMHEHEEGEEHDHEGE